MMDIMDLWTPTVENIEDLPPGLRRYIHELQTNNDLAGTIRENFRLHQETVALRKECERLKIAEGCANKEFSAGCCVRELRGLGSNAHSFATERITATGI